MLQVIVFSIKLCQWRNRQLIAMFFLNPPTTNHLPTSPPTTQPTDPTTTNPLIKLCLKDSKIWKKNFTECKHSWKNGKLLYIWIRSKAFIDWTTSVLITLSIRKRNGWGNCVCSQAFKRYCFILPQTFLRPYVSLFYLQ